jgi:hypothetical protein
MFKQDVREEIFEYLTEHLEFSIDAYPPGCVTLTVKLTNPVTDERATLFSDMIEIEPDRRIRLYDQ